MFLCNNDRPDVFHNSEVGRKQSHRYINLHRNDVAASDIITTCTHVPLFWSVHLLCLVVFFSCPSVSDVFVCPLRLFQTLAKQRQLIDVHARVLGLVSPSCFLPQDCTAGGRWEYKHTHHVFTSWSTVWFNMIPLERSDGLRHLTTMKPSSQYVKVLSAECTLSMISKNTPTDFWFYLISNYKSEGLSDDYWEIKQQNKRSF